MKLNKTIAFALLTAVMAFSVYLFEYKKDQLLQKDEDAVIISYPADQISYFQVVKPSIKIGLQKGETGWTLLEPIHEPADNTVAEELLNTLTIEKPLAVVKISENALTETELSEYGLDKPAIVFNFKNNQGLAKNCSTRSQPRGALQLPQSQFRFCLSAP